MLNQLLTDEFISKVYCPVRGSDPHQRILDSLNSRGIAPKDPSTLCKVIAFTGDLQKPDLGLNDSVIYSQILSELVLIIHIAWPVNFNISLSSFEPHIAGLHNLLQLSLAVHRAAPAQVLFCSSISTASGTPSPASIPEAPIEDISQSSRTGYGQSKLVGEHVVRNATNAGARAHVLRIGQVVGDKRNAIWNDVEFIPSIIRSALQLKALPSLPNEVSQIYTLGFNPA